MPIWFYHRKRKEHKEKSTQRTHRSSLKSLQLPIVTPAATKDIKNISHPAQKNVPLFIKLIERTLIWMN